MCNVAWPNATKPCHRRRGSGSYRHQCRRHHRRRRRHLRRRREHRGLAGSDLGTGGASMSLVLFAIRWPISFHSVSRTSARWRQRISPGLSMCRVRHDVEVTRRIAAPSSRPRAIIAAVALLAVVTAGAGAWFWGMRSSGVPQNFAAFVGQWDGIWDNQPQATTSLTVEVRQPDRRSYWLVHFHVGRSYRVCREDRQQRDKLWESL
jgi:hypothetical protein